ncbi:MAG: thiamine pyrophosphate-dependent enzyme, partial [Pseudobdellovibrionaceae bacterium]
MTKPSVDSKSNRTVAGRLNKNAAKIKEKSLIKNQTPSSKSQKMSAFQGLDKATVLHMHSLMVKSRVLEERLIKIYRAGESFFWIGGPGEEAFGVPMGMLVKKGQGLAHDFLHLHYRCTSTLIAMGMPMIDSIRLMMNRTTDSSTGGRNFSNHYCFPQWNVAPVTSPIGVQYPIACGTAHAQKRAGHSSLTVVTGGDAGTAEGDFASSLILASRKGSELPLLLTVQNNKWGISTRFDGQHGEKFIADRAKAFQIKSRVMNGNDPV